MTRRGRKQLHTVFHSSSSRLRIPDPKKHSLPPDHLFVSGGVRYSVTNEFWSLHHLLLCVPSPELAKPRIVYVFDVLRIHGDVLLENPGQEQKGRTDAYRNDGTDHTLSTHRILRFIVVALHSSKSSANTSNIYPEF